MVQTRHRTSNYRRKSAQPTKFKKKAKSKTRSKDGLPRNLSILQTHGTFYASQKARTAKEYSFHQMVSSLQIEIKKIKNWILSTLTLTLGLNLSITQAQKSSEKIESELCLTNMAFTHGVHYWEINAQISCQFVLIGVYNPVQKTEHLMSFTPKTPRAIFVCLDLFEGSVKFWLNEKRKNRSLKLPMGGPWIPCVKIGHERNVISLNPFAVPPTELTES